jgi:hypothetical protein
MFVHIRWTAIDDRKWPNGSIHQLKFNNGLITNLNNTLYSLNEWATIIYMYHLIANMLHMWYLF